MSHISELKLEIKDVGDVNMVISKLNSLLSSKGITATLHGEISDYYGHKYNYDNIAFYIYVNKIGRYVGVTRDGKIIGDVWGLTEEELQRLKDAVVASVISTELESNGIMTEIKEEEEGYEVLAVMPE